MTKRRNTDHIRVRNIEEGPLIYCDHCGAAQSARLPMPLDEWSAIGKRFQRAHRHCQPPASAPLPAADAEE